MSHIPSAHPSSFQVLTVNIHKGFSSFNRRFVLPELRDAIRQVGAEVVVLQEVHGRRSAASDAAGRVRWPDTTHYEYLADSLWPEWAYGRNAVYPQGDHGNAVLSKFPIESWRNHDVSDRGELEPRGLLHCRLRLPDADQAVHVVGVHLGLKESTRHRQVKQLGDLIEAHVPEEEPLVVAGDFNDWLGRARKSLRELGLQEVHAIRRGRPPRTFPARFPLLRLDRIYVRAIRRSSAIDLPRHPWAALSDHAPLAARVEV